MKKLTLTLAVILTSYITFAQTEIKGTVIQLNKCQLNDSGGYKVLKTTYPMRMRVKLSDRELVIVNDHYTRFLLTDKMVDSSYNQLVVHYLSSAYKRLWMVAARECDGFLTIGIFPMDGGTKFTEYKIKYKK